MIGSSISPPTHALRFCPMCGDPVSVTGSRFCGSCGKELPVLEQERVSPLDEPLGVAGLAPRPALAAAWARPLPGEPDYPREGAGLPSPASRTSPPVFAGPTLPGGPFYPPPITPTAVVAVNGHTGPGAIVRILWFLFIGLWLGAILTAVAYVMCLSIILLPIGLDLFNSLPAVMTLRPPSNRIQVTVAGQVTTVHMGMRARQPAFLVRMIYFFLIGWWFTALWLALAWFFVALAVITLGASLAPAFLMFDRVPKVLTLRAN